MIRTLASVAARWLDPDDDIRQDAIERTLDADNRFTEAAVNFAVNQQMSLLTPEALTAWQANLGWSPGQRVAVLNPGNIPFVELQDLVAVLLSGRTWVGTVSSRSPALLPAFVSDLLEVDSSIPADLAAWEDALGGADRLIASGSDATMDAIREAADEEGLSADRCWFRGHRISVAVLNGQEAQDDLVDLAEDALLHEGLGCRNVSIVFAPASMPIDPVLDAMATFRGLFEAHERTVGQLKMQQALLQAVGVPHAWAEGHQFLISRGEADPQGPAHIRWVPYAHREEAEAWIAGHHTSIQGVFSTMKLASASVPVEPLGFAQRPSLTWCPDGRSHVDFLGHKDLP